MMKWIFKRILTEKGQVKELQMHSYTDECIVCTLGCLSYGDEQIN